MSSYQDKFDKIFKYNYGYQNYDLGRKYILQTYKNLGDYFYDAAKTYISSALSGDMSSLSYDVSNLTNDEAKNIEKEVTFVKKVDNFSILVINVKVLVEKLNIKNIEVFFEDLKNDLKNKSFWIEDNSYVISIWGENKDIDSLTIEQAISLLGYDFKDLEILFNSQKFGL